MSWGVNPLIRRSSFRPGVFKLNETQADGSIPPPRQEVVTQQNLTANMDHHSARAIHGLRNRSERSADSRAIQSNRWTQRRSQTKANNGATQPSRQQDQSSSEYVGEQQHFVSD